MTHPLPELIIKNKLVCHYNPLHLLCTSSTGLSVGCEHLKVMMKLFFFSKQEELSPDDPSVLQESRDNRKVNLLQNSMPSSLSAGLRINVMINF